jgi:hypothetical protein
MDFKGGINFWNDALYLIEFNRFKGGIVIIVLTKLAPLIEEHGVLILGRVQYVIVRLSTTMKIRIMNVYAPNFTTGKVRLWQTFANPN